MSIDIFTVSQGWHSLLYTSHMKHWWNCYRHDISLWILKYGIRGGRKFATLFNCYRCISLSYATKVQSMNFTQIALFPSINLHVVFFHFPLVNCDIKCPLRIGHLSEGPWSGHQSAHVCDKLLIFDESRVAFSVYFNLDYWTRYFKKKRQAVIARFSILRGKKLKFR